MQRFKLCAILVVFGFAQSATAQDFTASFAQAPDRVWLGAEFWANPLEDWRIHKGRLECVSNGANRNVQLLTRQLSKQSRLLMMSVRLGRLDQGDVQGSAGFRIGITDEIDDYRARLLYGQGLNAGVTTDGSLFIGNTVNPKVVPPELLARGIELQLQAPGDVAGQQYAVALTAADPVSRKLLGTVALETLTSPLVGNIALVNNHFGVGKAPKKGKADMPGARFWFDDWKIAGGKVEVNDSQSFGPILFSMYTLSRGVLKLTAQMPPIGDKESQTVRLQIPASPLRKQGENWKTIAEAKIAPLSYTATFRVPSWNDKEDTPYRLAYTTTTRSGAKQESYYSGTVRKDPVQKPTLVLGALSCIADFAFPNREVVRNLMNQDPDLLFFAGDQVYEQAGGYGIIREPVDRACNNYLRKWYIFGWSFRDLTRDRPTVTIPDDHDVYQGNIWGNGGNAVSLAEHDAGGYVMHKDFVNCVHRTQTAHLPDPYDPTPIQQGITAYYGDMIYGRVSFAIIADRMFKNGPRGSVATWPGRPDHVRDPKIDVKALDKPGLQLLGERQEKFLRHWITDWKGADMKCVLSQTIFCNLANYHGPKREFLIADLDSGGWPQTARNRAVDLMRKGFALHVAGDQHLASIVQYGIEEPNDANFSFCVPSVANIYPRAWLPDKEALPVKNRIAGLANTGDYLDGLKNPIRVFAVGNPEDTFRAGRVASLQDKACGHGIVRFNRKEQTMTMECWRLLVDVTNPKPGDQFPGWPKTIKMQDNYGRKPAGHLPTLEIQGVTNPVVQVIDEKTEEAIYALRVLGSRFRPMVFGPGPYTVIVGDPDNNRQRAIKGLRLGVGETIKVTVP